MTYVNGNMIQIHGFDETVREAEELYEEAARRIAEIRKEARKMLEERGTKIAMSFSTEAEAEDFICRTELAIPEMKLRYKRTSVDFGFAETLLTHITRVSDGRYYPDLDSSSDEE